MEVTALCLGLVMNMLMLLVAHVRQSYPHTSDAALRVVPTRLQFFEYDPVHFICEGSDVSAGWRVMKIKSSNLKCSNDTVTSSVTCIIDFAFKSDSGEYWCEGGGGGRSNTVNITVTDGPVILESPVLPVMEGVAVTLSCREQTPSNLTAHFYKDGLHIGTSSTGNLTITPVSKSDEGLYKCRISIVGESAESWLAVRSKYGEGGPVTLESPSSVTEGDDVTLSCRTQETSSDLTAEFYKDGRLMGSRSAGEMIIHSVSKSDEGLYKCRISDVGESAERRLHVKVQVPKFKGSGGDSNTECTGGTASGKEANHETVSHHLFLLLWAVITVVLVLLLLLMGFLYWMKQLVSLEAMMRDPNMDPHDVIGGDENQPPHQSSCSNDNVIYTSVALQNESGVSTFAV